MAKIKQIKKILIANRGEIACRIINSCHEMGIRTVAIYSHVDRNALHVEMADEAYEVGEAPSAQSYLNQSRILEIIKNSGADAVHPAYGFLSENTEFAKLLEKNNIIFIAPPVKAIEAMGDKSKSKQLMEQAGVPLLGGYHGDKQEADFLLQQSEKIGFPVLIKASAGGGGKGMRIVRDKKEFAAQLEGAKREALKSFGNDHVLIEKYVENPRHVEVQIFGDQHGTILHLFERDCSIQRRHQKIIEEAPAPNIKKETRAKITQAAIKAARAVDYYNAGTVEFLMDKDENFYFMEMNTRLQVEHPVTEAITGHDLVAWQILVAEGHKLPLTQQDIECNGHAIEVRLYAEDPYKDFLPQAGTIHHFSLPESDENFTRLDSAIAPCQTFLGDDPFQGGRISMYYDPMIAKLIVHGNDRADAVEKMQHVLSQSCLAGLGNNLEFLHRLVCHPDFVHANLSTGFIDKNPELLEPHESAELLVFAALSLHCHKQCQTQMNHQNDMPHQNTAFWPNQTIKRGYKIADKDFTVTHDTPDLWQFTIQNETTNAVCHIQDIDENEIFGTVNGEDFHISAVVLDDAIYIKDKAQVFSAFQKIAYHNPLLVTKNASHATNLSAPMPATVIDVLIKTGDSVKQGDKLLILEAMKMEHIIRAPFDGVIAQIGAAKGDKVEEGKQLVFFASNNNEGKNAKKSA